MKYKKRSNEDEQEGSYDQEDHKKCINWSQRNSSMRKWRHRDEGGEPQEKSKWTDIHTQCYN